MILKFAVVNFLHVIAASLSFGWLLFDDI